MKQIQLRQYQVKCIAKMLWSLTLEGNSIVSVAQGGGKTIIISEFVRQLGKPILILVPSKELLEQDLEKLNEVSDDIGVFSASMKSKEVRKITIATIQSAYKYPELFTHYEVVIIDEADLVNPKNLEGMYNQFFRAIGNPKVLGLTATPFRQGVMYEKWGGQKWMMNAITTTKMIVRMRERFWSRIIEVVNIKDLIEQKYLCSMTYHDLSVVKHENIPTNKSKSEFDLEYYEKRLCNSYTDLAKFISGLSHNKTLIFCTSIEQAQGISQLTPNSRVVTSETSTKERDQTIKDFRSGAIRILFGVNIFTIGFNIPDLDCIVSLRPTRSLRLWTQVLGRGSRIFEGKETCHVYDFAGNIKSLGTFESMEIKKIEEKWNVSTSTKPEGFHNVGLFSYQLKQPKKQEEQLFV